MALQAVNLGTAPSGVGGDTPRSAFQKVNDQFSEVYAALGGTGAPLALPAVLPLTKGGTGGNSAADARSKLGLGSAAVAAIVGTVSQSGGVPNGAIIEQGANASGQYTKFADGTLICRGISSAPYVSNTPANGIFYSTGIGFAFPIAFTVVPSVALQCVTAATYFCWAAAEGAASNAGITGRVISPVNGGQAYLSYIAVGRWY